MSNVKPREGGPYSLYCYTCNSWVPNTANHEMKKEGAYSHSHSCWIESEGLRGRESGSAIPDEKKALYYQYKDMTRDELAQELTDMFYWARGVKPSDLKKIEQSPGGLQQFMRDTLDKAVLK